MTTLLSSTTILFLTAMCGLCLIKTAVGVPAAALTTPPSNEDASDSSKGVENANMDTPAPELGEEEDIGMESSHISKLRTNKVCFSCHNYSTAFCNG